MFSPALPNNDVGSSGMVLATWLGFGQKSKKNAKK
jgi:hypothetical protein